MGHCSTVQGLGLYHLPLPKAGAQSPQGPGSGVETWWMGGSMDPVTTAGCTRREAVSGSSLQWLRLGGGVGGNPRGQRIQEPGVRKGGPVPFPLPLRLRVREVELNCHPAGGRAWREARRPSRRASGSRSEY